MNQNRIENLNRKLLDRTVEPFQGRFNSNFTRGRLSGFDIFEDGEVGVRNSCSGEFREMSPEERAAWQGLKQSISQETKAIVGQIAADLSVAHPLTVDEEQSIEINLLSGVADFFRDQLLTSHSMNHDRPHDNDDLVISENLPEDNQSRTEQEHFEAFHEANPHVYEALKEMALKKKRSGYNTYGFDPLYEVLRWHYALKFVG